MIRPSPDHPALFSAANPTHPDRGFAPALLPRCNHPL